MKTIQLDQLTESSDQLKEICHVLQQEGLVCLPCNASYRIIADVKSEKAVNRLLQSKRRTRKAPSLVFVSGKSMLGQVAAEVDPVTTKLVDKLWPGPLTILFVASPELPAKVVKQLCKATGKLGVRMPADEIVQLVVRSFGSPVLVSSANKERKSGAHSPAQVRKNFIGKVDLFVDAGDLAPQPASTVVDVVDGKVVITRPGALDQDKIASFM